MKALYTGIMLPMFITTISQGAYLLSDELTFMKLEYSRDFLVAGDSSDDGYWYDFEFETSYNVQSITVSRGGFSQSVSYPYYGEDTGSGYVWYINDWNSSTPYDSALDGVISVTVEYTDLSTGSTTLPYTLDDGTTPIPPFVDEPVFSSPANLNATAIRGISTVFEWPPPPAHANYFEIGDHLAGDDDGLIKMFASGITDPFFPPIDGPISTTTSGLIPLRHGFNSIALFQGYFRSDTNADGIDYVVIKLAENYRQFYAAGAQAKYDDFNDNEIDMFKWGLPFPQPGDSLLEINNRLEYSSPSGSDGSSSLSWWHNFLSTTQGWSMAVSGAFLSEHANVDLCLGVDVGNYGYALKFFTDGAADYQLNTVAFDIVTDIPFLDEYLHIGYEPEVLLRIDYDAAAQTLTSSYERDGSFEILETISIAGWGVVGTSQFAPILYVDNHNVPVAPGEVYFDNFMIWWGDNGDLDRDGLHDDWEIQYFGSTNAPDANSDSDGDNDNSLNWQEEIAGTNPTNGASVFAVTNTAPSPSGFVLNWPSVEGRVYTVEWADALTDSFQMLTNGIVHPQNSYTDTVHAAESGGFYNLKVELGN